MLARVSNEIVRAQKEFFGKGPTQAKSYAFDDLLFVVMRNGLTVAEKTMLDFGHPDQVRQFRQIFQNEMGAQLMGTVEEITGRKVVTYQSQVLFDPDLTVELFVFDAPADADARAATARAALGDGDAGAASDADVLDPPARTPAGVRD
jgi:uncharacterized protein YbcI